MDRCHGVKFLNCGGCGYGWVTAVYVCLGTGATGAVLGAIRQQANKGCITLPLQPKIGQPRAKFGTGMSFACEVFWAFGPTPTRVL